MMKSQESLEEEDPITYFESSLETLFGQHQPATGEPGKLCQVNLDEQCSIQYRIPFSQTNKLFAHYQWDSGLFLCHLIYQSSKNENVQVSRSEYHYRPEANVIRQSVLELGAGTGLPSIISAKCGASKVLITDYPDQSILDALNENVKLSNFDEGQRKHVQVKGLDWSNDEMIQQIVDQNPLGFQRVFCADVLWLSSSHQPLLETILATLAYNKDSRCIIVSGFHTGRRALVRFFDLACGGQLKDLVSLQPSKDEDGNLIVFEYNVITKERRRWTGTKHFLNGEEDDEYDNMDDFTERTKWLLYVCLEWKM